MSEDGQMTLVEFLTARLNEDEDKAEECERSFAHSKLGDYGSDSFRTADIDWWRIERYSYTPARMRAEVEAKRRIIDQHPPSSSFGFVDCRTCRDLLGPGEMSASADSWPCTTLRLLALPYADHLDYDEAWRPMAPAFQPGSGR